MSDADDHSESRTGTGPERDSGHTVHIGKRCACLRKGRVAARDAGFTLVESAGGDVDSLVQLARDRCTPRAGAFLHPAGSDVAGDLAGQLGAAGFAVRRTVLYHAEAATTLSQEVVLALSEHLIDLALFYSPRSAATFVSLARRDGLEKACEKLEILCLSKAVAEAADPIMWRRVMIAPHPVQDALLDTLDERLHSQ